MFWVDAELESKMYLDSVVSLADAKYLSGHLRQDAPESLQVIRQLAFADHIILNKKDLGLITRLLLHCNCLF
jgi:G3E family GTPase